MVGLENGDETANLPIINNNNNNNKLYMDPWGFPGVAQMAKSLPFVQETGFNLGGRS